MNSIFSSKLFLQRSIRLLRKIFRINTLYTIDGGAVILTFDDDSVFEWHTAAQVLRKYNWKATFFISHFNSLKAEDIERLRDLQFKGHEIASHSENHLNAIEFISSKSLEEYIKLDILPSMNGMKEKGIAVSAFAYPYGMRNKELDRILLRYFKIIRGTTYAEENPLNNNNFANGSKVVFGLGIDKSYGLDDNYLLAILKYAKEHSKIAIFYGHRVVQESNPPQYATSYRTLEAICRYTAENNMCFMTMKDLLLNLA